MNRRNILQLTGAAFATGTGVTSSTNRQKAETNDEKEDQETLVCNPDLQFRDGELIIDESGLSPVAYAGVVVENVGDAASGEISLRASWMDREGNFIDDDSTTLPSLGDNERWIAYIRALPDAEEIVDFDIRGEFEVSPPRTPPGLTVVESNFDYGENEIAGVIENTREQDIEYVEAYGKIYNEEGTLVGGGSTLESELPAGRDWTFEIGTPLLPADVEPTDHAVILDARTFLIRG